MNDLNTKWQGSNQQINKLYQYMNLKKLKKQITAKNFAPFAGLNINQTTDNSIYINFLQDLRKQFQKRFTNMHSKKLDLKLHSQPFDVEPEDVYKDFQMELIEL